MVTRNVFKKFTVGTLCKSLLILTFIIYLTFIPKQYSYFSVLGSFFPRSSSDFPTDHNHLVFGILGSKNAYHQRKHYIQSWWRPNACRGLLYLDENPKNELLPWSKAPPPYKISKNLTNFLEETKSLAPIMIQMVHGIMEVFPEFDDHDQTFRWLVMGDDDLIFFVDDMVDVLAKLDPTKYYYLGGQSAYVMSNYRYSFNHGFGGARFILSYPLAKALAQDMDNCLRRYAHLSSTDLITMVCIAVIGVNLSPQMGIHQIELRGDISGFLSSHPKSPLIFLHHFDCVQPLFPAVMNPLATSKRPRPIDRVCCNKQSVTTGKRIGHFPCLGAILHTYTIESCRGVFYKNPIETFKTWLDIRREPPHYMFNTRLPNNTRVPHVFFFEKIMKTPKGVLNVNSRKHSEDLLSEIRVLSPATKCKEMDRCECCDIRNVYGNKAKLKFKECMLDEIIA